MTELPWGDDEDDTPLCPVCGAYSSRSCEMLEEGGGECPWEMMQPDEPSDERRSP
jgi:hypothetical protein